MYTTGALLAIYNRETISDSGCHNARHHNLEGVGIVFIKTNLKVTIAAALVMSKNCLLVQS